MSTLSKFFGDTLGMTILPSNCYETVHTWEPNCNKAIQVAVGNGFRFSLRTYATVYLLTHLLSARGDPRKVKWRKVILSTLQSSVFLTSNLIGYLWFMCRFRNTMGFWIWPTLGLTNGILASFVAILMEKKSRRPALAVYLTNLASETLFHQAVNHGYAKFVPNGQWIVFAIGLAIFFYLRSANKLDKSFEKILSTSHRLGSVDIVPQTVMNQLPDDFHSFINQLREKHSKTEHCEHKHSCVSTAVEGFSRNFTLGLGVSSALTVLKNAKSLIRQPTKVLRTLTSTNNLRIPLCFGLLPLIYHSSSCLLNRLSPSHTISNQVVSGALSGIALRAFPNVTIAMYTLWKAIEALYTDLANRGILPWVPHGDIILYSLTTGYVLFAATIEPQAVRGGYFKFLMGLTGNRLGVFNRKLFDVFGFKSSKLYSNFNPKLIAQFTTISPMLYQPIK